MRRQLGRYPGYNPNVDPSISNVFATAAYRFAHLAIQPMLSRLDANYRENIQFPSVSLFKAFFTPWRVIYEGGSRTEKRLRLRSGGVAPVLTFLVPPGGIDSLLRGLVGRPAKLNTQDHMMVNALREKLFLFVQHVALDLGSLNMQRGRDHGLPGTDPPPSSSPLIFLRRSLQSLRLNPASCSLLVLPRIQCMAQILRPVSAPERAGTGPRPEQHGPGPQAAGPVRHARQHRRVAGRRGRAFCP